MNTPILFLLGAVALSALGGLVVWIASRPRPERFGSSIDTFNRDLSALAPPGSKPKSRRGRPSRPAGQQPRMQMPNSTSQPGRPGPRPAKTVQPSGAGASARPKPGPRPGPQK